MTFVRPRFPSAPPRYDALNEANFRQQVEAAVLQAAGLIIQGDQIESLDAGSITGQLNDAQVAESNVTQHEAALELAASQVVSGQFADARISESSVLQHVSAGAISHARFTPQTHTSETGTLSEIPWSEDFDTDGGYFDAGDDTAITPPSAGVYEIVLHVELTISNPNHAPDRWQLNLRDGTSILASQTWHARATGSTGSLITQTLVYVAEFDGTEDLNVTTFQNFTDNESINTGTSFLYIRRISDAP